MLGSGDCCKVAKGIECSSGVVWIVVHESELEVRPMFESILDALVVFVVSVVECDDSVIIGGD